MTMFSKQLRESTTMTMFSSSLHPSLIFFFITASVLLIGVFTSIAAAEAEASRLHPKAIILPITKDQSTLQYLTQIRQRTPQVTVSLVVDIGGVYLWIDCDTGYASSSYKSAQCGSAQCHLLNSRKCNSLCYLNVTGPGCNDNSCDVNVYNPVSALNTGGEVTMDVLNVHGSNRDNSRSDIYLNQFPFICAPALLKKGLAEGASGMAGLGRGRSGMPALFAAELSLKRRFSVCLGSKGVVLIGDWSYKFADISRSLTYTPLILNPVYTAGIRYIGDPSTDYFIGVKSIEINSNPVKLNSTLLKISSGNGGTKLSTVHPYTVMEPSIYRAVIAAFRNEIVHIPTVAPVSPFGLCYNSNRFRGTAVGPGVPRIDLVLQSSEVKWSWFGANSMVQVSDEVMCLGVVDGGLLSFPMTSIVIGAHQLENVLLQFDLADSILGFSPSLLLMETTCSNFNSTAIA